MERTRSALRRDRLRLHSQPIVDLKTGRPCAEELLLRLATNDGHLVPPSRFLGPAERHGLIGHVDRWVADRGIALAAAGRPVHLNVSPTTVCDLDFAGHVEHALAAHTADPAAVTFELTETASAADLDEASRGGEALVALGCRLALDDFGSGWGALSYLNSLPVSSIKIDRELVAGAATNEKSRALLSALVDFAARLGLGTIAEGVEDDHTLQLMCTLGVSHAQGFHLGLPGAVEPGCATQRPSPPGAPG